MSTPASIINVCKGVRLNNSYEHTIYFDSAEAQLQYFAGKVDKTFSAYTYLRKSWNIKLQAKYEDARKWSYLYFQNGSGKIYYYFITQVEYVSDTTVELHLELDVMQTYHFDYSLLRCFVEREHTEDDTVGYNTVDEGLELGELKIIEETEVSELNDLCVLMLSTYNPISTTEEYTDTVLAAKYDGVFSGLGVYASNLTDWQALGVKLKLLDDAGKSDGIITLWMYPKELVTLEGDATWTDGNVTKEVSGSASFYKSVSRPTKTSGYEPRNNKLLTYPFNFLYVTNNTGGAGVFRYERFGDPTDCHFKIIGSLSPDGSTKIYPINYDGITHNYENGLTLGDFPTCAWNQDVYKLWLAQNQHQQSLEMGMALLKIGGGIVGAVATGGVGAVVSAGGIASGLTNIASLLAQKNDKEIQPPQAKGSYSASVNVSNGFHNFVIQKKSVSSEFAKIIDDYFDLYGYKINRVKVPNRNVRENWTYTKTIGCHIKGDFCVEDQTKIEGIYNKGVTFWKNGDSIGNYALTNQTS